MLETDAIDISNAAVTKLTGRELVLLLVLAAVQFTHIVDFMIIMPLGSRFMGDDPGTDIHMSPDGFGLVVSAYTISAALASLLAARFLDRFDRKTSLVALFAGFTAGTVLCGLATNYAFLLAARAIAGAFGGVCAANILAIVGDAFPDARRGRAMGAITSAFSVASIVGLPLGLVAVEWYGWRSPFFILGGIAGVVLLVAIWGLPSFRGHMRRSGTGPSVFAVALDPNHLRAFALMGAIVASSFLLAPYLPAVLVANGVLPETDIKYIYLAGGIVTLMTLPVIGRLSDRLPKLRMFQVLAAATSLSFISITILPAGIGLAAVLAVTTVMFITTSGRMVPGMALITASAPPAIRGSFMSLNSAVQQTTMGLASWLGGLMLHKTAEGTLAGYPLAGVLAAGICMTTVYLAGRLRPAFTQAPDSTVVRGDQLPDGVQVSADKDADRPAA
jgi:MFS transporter, DHA1 family, inner membrane transport protein